MAQYSFKEIEDLAAGGKILGTILEILAKAVRPGISTLDLDKLARSEIQKAGAEAAFPGYRISPDDIAYPAALCVSVDDEIVHGIPRADRILREGEIVGLDLGIKYRGLYTDAARTVAVGRISREKQKLIEATKRALDEGIAAIAPCRTIGDVAAAIESVGRKNRLGVVRDLVGHGVGHAIHEPPNVPNYGKPGSLEKLLSGMVLAIEPMFTSRGHRINFLEDGWTVVTADGSIAAHFEDTIVVTGKGAEILTRPEV